DQLAEFAGQVLPQSRGARFGKGRQDGGEEEVQRDAILDALRDEDALAGANPGLLLGEGQRRDGRNASQGGSPDAIEFDPRLAGADQLPKPGTLIVNEI